MSGSGALSPPVIPARTPPHAPFRAGAPRFTPALSPIDPSRWLTPDSERHVLTWKQTLLDEPAAVFRAEPGAAESTREAADRVGQALHLPCGGDLVAASRGLSDDLVVMGANGAGRWICQALTLTAPTFFAIDDVIGRDLTALHAPTPHGAALAGRIARVFDGVRPGLVLERFNWTLQAGPERFTPDAGFLRERALKTPDSEALSVLHLRVERQTIVKLARTGAVLFAIRVCLDPLSQLERDDRRALAAAWRALGAEGRAYKGWAAYENLAGAAFDAWGV